MSHLRKKIPSISFFLPLLQEVNRTSVKKKEKEKNSNFLKPLAQLEQKEENLLTHSQTQRAVTPMCCRCCLGCTDSCLLRVKSSVPLFIFSSFRKKRQRLILRSGCLELAQLSSSLFISFPDLFLKTQAKEERRRETGLRSKIRRRGKP